MYKVHCYIKISFVAGPDDESCEITTNGLKEPCLVNGV